MKEEKINRRSFIKRTAFATAAAAPFFIARDLLANGSPNEKVNVAVIGIGKQVPAHLSYAGMDVCRLMAVCDVDTERTAWAKQKLGQHQSQWILMKDAALDKDPQSIILGQHQRLWNRLIF